MKKHVNIPIFIPHLGCPNQCVFCNQHTISGVDEFDAASVRMKIENALATINDGTEVEVAFFGGSFTGIDRDLMISLLEIAKEYIDRGKISSIRCSTRPDYIDGETVSILKQYGVKTVELGLQSSNDDVLKSCKRGHLKTDEQRACELIVESGLQLVGQMMIGLPGATLDDELDTARFIVNSGATAARIYPTIVFRGTELCEMTREDKYIPLSLKDAVLRSASVLDYLICNNIEILRIGLCASENLADADKYYAGPNHPAIGEMVISEVYYSRIRSELTALTSSLNDSNALTIYVPKGAMSKALGHKKCNIDRLYRDYRYTDIRFKEDNSLMDYQVYVEERRDKCI